MKSRLAETNSLTFPVADVEPAKKPLEEVAYRDAIEQLLEAERLVKGRDYRLIEAWSGGSARLAAGVAHHPFMAAMRMAYAQHRPLALSPDMIWLLICQGVAQHINANSEALRPRLVEHPGRLTLEVERRDHGRFRKGSPENPWPEVFAAWSSQIRDHIGPKHDLFIPSFTTTGLIERAASEIVLLDSMQRYFHYLLSTFICGIPTISLEGTADDWRAISERADEFIDLELDWWLDPLRPILRQFASAAVGEADPTFWQSMYRLHQPRGCSPDSAVGWIGLFFPYLTDETGQASQRNPWLAGERDLSELLDPKSADRRPSEDDDESDYLLDHQLPSGMAKAPFTWEERNLNGELLNRWKMELLGGFVGVAQDPATLRLRPEIGWAVRETADNE